MNSPFNFHTNKIIARKNLLGMTLKYHIEKQNCSHNLADILQNLAIGLGTIEWKLEIGPPKQNLSSFKVWGYWIYFWFLTFWGKESWRMMDLKKHRPSYPQQKDKKKRNRLSIVLLIAGAWFPKFPKSRWLTATGKPNAALMALLD